ncbi:MAG: 50S ribosomal protein L23 [Zetaproteobacteria bacterium]|nr:MAG: 50S ribosomal protein L23 [Zetaproteobacteria bacterium]
MTPMEKHCRVLLAPVITEKSYAAQAENNQYTFRVARDATKRDVKAAVEALFGVQVVSVQIMNMPRKPKRRGWREGYRPGYRKAVVRLAEGQSLDQEAAAEALAQEGKE